MPRSEGNAMLPRSDLLLALSRELDALGVSAASLQTTLGGILDGPSAAGPAGEGFWHMQEIDRMQQTLEDLAMILQRTAQHDGPSLDIDDLLSATRLGALRERLSGSDRQDAPAEQSGVLALF